MYGIWFLFFAAGPQRAALPPGPLVPDQQAGRQPDWDAAGEPRPVQPGSAPSGGRGSPHNRGLTLRGRGRGWRHLWRHDRSGQMERWGGRGKWCRETKGDRDMLYGHCRKTPTPPTTQKTKQALLTSSCHSRIWIVESGAHMQHTRQQRKRMINSLRRRCCLLLFNLLIW